MRLKAAQLRRANICFLSSRTDRLNPKGARLARGRSALECAPLAIELLIGFQDFFERRTVVVANVRDPPAVACVGQRENNAVRLT